MILLVGTKTAVGALEEALLILEQELGKTAEPENKAKLYSEIAAVLKTRGDQGLRAIALEKAIEYTPTDNRARFDLAYGSSLAGFGELSALNYDTLLRFEPKNAVALNNLANGCSELGMPIKGVSLLRRAEQLKETLAMSNLASRLLDQGFVAEASETLEKAEAEADLHPNIARYRVLISERNEAERDAWTSVRGVGLKQQEFFRSFAEAWFVPLETVPFAGEWSLPDGEKLTLVQTGLQISGEWGTYDKRQVHGKIHNRAAQVDVNKWKQHLLRDTGYFAFETKGYAYFTHDGRYLHLITVGEGEKLFLRFERG